MTAASYIKSFLLGILAAAACACTEVEPENDFSGVTLDIIASPATKAEMPGVDNYNENLINSVHYFFYAKGDHSHAILYGNQGGLNVKNDALIRVNMDEGTVNNILFPRPENKCDVFIIVNLPAGTDIPVNTSLESIRAMALAANFNAAEKQANFVMQGLGEATITDRRKTIAASGTIPVDRIASKLTVGVIVPPKYELKDSHDVVQETWIPQPEGMKIVLHKGKRTATIGSEPQQVGSDHFNSNERTFSIGTLQGASLSTGDRAYACNAPFYSYPEKWSVGEDDAPYLTITLPWSLDDGSGNFSFQKCYYKVLINGTSLEANNWYNINVRLGVLGSFTEAEPTIEIQDNFVTYYVEDWTEALKDNEDIMMNIVQAEIKGAQYLVVPTTDYSMYNTNTLSIPYSTSHDCEIVSISATKYNFKNYNYTNVSSSVSVSLEQGVIKVSRTINNNVTSSGFDAAPINISFIIRHKGDDDYSETITITQYPAMYIQGFKSNGKVFVNGTGYSGTSDYVSLQNNLGSISKPSTIDGSGENNNQYQYVVHISALSGSTAIIGDPRVGNTTAVGSLTDLPGNYKPTAEDTQTTIAPSMRIASSYGKTTPLSYANAQRRCAAYQENGYPAGRWRLPTEAEIEYLVSLSKNNVIPTLFAASSNYWAAGGRVFNGSQFSNGTSNSYVRCVYDEWYWGSQQDNAHMTTWSGYQTNL